MLRPFLILSVAVRFALGWGVVGHEIVATIAQMHLHATTVDNLCNVLPTYASCHLAPIAAWADKIRHNYPWSAHMHYIGDRRDHPSQHCAFGQNGWEDDHYNVINAIRNTTRWIEEERAGQEEALKFLVHFVGDLHMPLHLTGRDRGGNDMKVKFDGRITNLHSVWDTRLIAKSVRTVPHKYNFPLPSPRVENALRGTIYDPYIRQIMWEGVLGLWRNETEDWASCSRESILRISDKDSQKIFETYGTESETSDALVCPYAWSRPIHQLNCDIVWPASLDNNNILDVERSKHHYLELDTPEYAGTIRSQNIVEKLLAMAGVRLASVLNGLYA